MVVLVVLSRINRFLEKCMPLITPFSLIVGVFFAPFFGQYRFLVTWMFAFLTFSGSLGCGVRDIVTVFRRPVSLIAALAVIHLGMPLTVRIVGGWLFDNSDLVTGMLLQYSIPTAVVGLVWVSIYGGNSAFSLSLVLVDTLLSPLLTPLSLQLFAGSRVSVDPMSMIRDLVLMIALPALLAIVCHDLSRGRVKTTVSPVLAPFSKLALMAVVMINSSRVAPFFSAMTTELMAVTALMLVFSASGFVWGWAVSKLIKGDEHDTVSLTFGCGMRNISAGAVIAAQYFPAITLFPVMISTLFQQMLAALAGWVLKRIRKPHP